MNEGGLSPSELCRVGPFLNLLINIFCDLHQNWANPVALGESDRLGVAAVRFGWGWRREGLSRPLSIHF